MKSPWLKVLLALSFCFLLPACSSHNKIGNVLIDIAGCAPAEEASQLKLTLRFNNENVFPIAIAETSGKLYLNNEYVGSYRHAAAVGIPQVMSITREVTLAVENPAVIARVRGASAVAYRLESVMRMEVSDDKSRLRSVVNGQLEGSALRAAAK